MGYENLGWKKYSYHYRKLRNTAIYHAFTRFCLFTETYEIFEGTRCKDGLTTSVPLNNLQQAKKYCAEDKECLSVHDANCDGLGTFKLCKNFYGPITGSIYCQHKKMISHGKYKSDSP